MPARFLTVVFPSTSTLREKVFQVQDDFKVDQVIKEISNGTRGTIDTSNCGLWIEDYKIFLETDRTIGSFAELLTATENRVHLKERRTDQKTKVMVAYFLGVLTGALLVGGFGFMSRSH